MVFGGNAKWKLTFPPDEIDVADGVIDWVPAIGAESVKGTSFTSDSVAALPSKYTFTRYEPGKSVNVLPGHTYPCVRPMNASVLWRDTLPIRHSLPHASTSAICSFSFPVFGTPSAANNNSITIVSPNGGETVSFGSPYLYRFTTTLPGVVDLTLVPYPPIDASLVCKIATGAVSSAGQISVTLPLSGTCPLGPAKTVSGTYKLLGTLRNGDINTSSDLSDATFTVNATTTVSQ